MQLANKDKCCGCSACYSICSKSAISMVPEKSGFRYPIICEDKCVHCGACVKACPAVNPCYKTDEIFQPVACLLQHLNDTIRKESTSGGAFTAIAEVIIDRKGVVFGAAMQDDLVVRHCFAETNAELAKFRNSKYVQSEIGDSFKIIKNFLNSDRWVLFSGTPCQVKGLLSFLGKKYDKLVTVDIVCHSVPSPAVFKKYLDLQLMKYPTTKKIVFRDKQRGYDYSTMAFYGEDNDGKSITLYRKGSESDLWFRSFLPGLCDRENCYDCIYQEYPRSSDITIWDCFNVGSLHPDFDDNKGTTSVAIWTNVGYEIVNESKNTRIHWVDIEVFKNKINREKDNKITVDRNAMYDDLEKLTPKEFFDKYRKSTVRVKVKGVVRNMLYYTGLQSHAKALKAKLVSRK